MLHLYTLSPLEFILPLWVITSEGNAAFYEAGCMDAPLNRGYSILGWNHPGFGSSTGKPHPDQV